MTYAATERAPLSLSAANVDYAALLLRVALSADFCPSRNFSAAESSAGFGVRANARR